MKFIGACCAVPFEGSEVTIGTTAARAPVTRTAAMPILHEETYEEALKVLGLTEINKTVVPLKDHIYYCFSEKQEII